jgi:hypothetical protein
LPQKSKSITTIQDRLFVRVLVLPRRASLERATQRPPTRVAMDIIPRRNLLGGPKIPARISQAQVRLEGLGHVRAEAESVSLESFCSDDRQLKVVVSPGPKASISPSRWEYCESPNALLERSWRRHSPCATSPAFINLLRSHFQAWSSTCPNPPLEPADPQNQFVAVFFHPEQISRECAELFMELGDGPQVVLCLNKLPAKPGLDWPSQARARRRLLRGFGPVEL